MADVTSENESDWGPEQSECPPVGSIFLMFLGRPGDIQADPKINRCKFKLVQMNQDELILKQWYGAGGWIGGHTWFMSYKPTFRLLISDVSVPAREMATSKVEGCVCTKCNFHNQWAEPNQKDGTYICRQCRPSWMR